jgi:hypothetical protein
MRIFAAFATASFLAASPCMAQIVISPGGDDSARHQYRADQQEHAARYDEHRARQDAAVGNYRGAAQAQDEARHHQAVAEDQEHRADRDSRGGVRVEIGR